jgi:hypothetical protein
LLHRPSRSVYGKSSQNSRTKKTYCKGSTWEGFMVIFLIGAFFTAVVKEGIW